MRSGIIGSVVSHMVVEVMFAEVFVKCKKKSGEYMNEFTLKAIVKMGIQVRSFFKAENIAQDV